MHVENAELRTTREVAREISSILDTLASGSAEKIVVTRNGKLVGVIITPERFDSLVGSQ